ncbi:MAG: DUF2892 domain-containing protein [Elusimicrobia bacterium]|nr:DUF2892 domain-containing protein [Elusimicrobiota bacterium]
MLSSNVGKADRVVRVVVGLGVLAAGWRFHSPLGLIGLVPLLTAALGWCPAYLPFGLSTACSAKGCPPK